METTKKAPTEKQLAARATFAAARKSEAQSRQQQSYSPQTVTMEQAVKTVSDIRPFRSKKGSLYIDEEKMYEFELVTRNEALRPRDKKTDTPLGSGYPPSFSYPNHGTAWNENTKKFENWRYIDGQASIFVSEQPELENYEKEQIHELLGQAENQLEFKDGKMLVAGNASGRLRIQALFAQNYFVGNEKPHKKNVATQFAFRLNNPDEVIEASLNLKETAFRTMQQALNCTITEMLAVSMIMGIDTADQSERGMNAIKNQFLAKAEYDPRNPKALEFFQSVINNPATRVKYIFAKAIELNIISSSQQPGKLTWVKPNTAIMDVRGKISLADELTSHYLDRNKVLYELLPELEKQINED